MDAYISPKLKQILANPNARQQLREALTGRREFVEFEGKKCRVVGAADAGMTSLTEPKK